MQTQEYFDRLASNRGLALTERKIAEDTFESGLMDLGVSLCTVMNL